MQEFQKIKSYENEKMFEDKLNRNLKEVISIDKSDNLIITEKVDGSNASINNSKGNILSFSHHKQLEEGNTLNGFYGFINSRKYLKNIPDNFIVFGEWLTPHRIKYPDDAYKKWYLFDIFDKDTSLFLGYNFAKHIYNKYDMDKDAEILMAPLLENDITGFSLEDLPDIQKQYSNKSSLSINGNMEGIVVTDLSKNVPITEETSGPLRIKLVNENFKETHMNSYKEPNNSLNSWTTDNINMARVSKKVLELQDEGKLPDKVSFDWMKSGDNNKISLICLMDALEESQELPKELKGVLNRTNKVVNKYIALSAKGLI